VFRGRRKRRTELAAAEPLAAAAPGTPAPETPATPAVPSAETAEGPKGGKPGTPPKRKRSPKAKGRPIRKGPARQTRTTRLVGLAFCVGGFVAIGLGWAGTASKDCVECQMPFLLSGGAAGLGLVVFGVGMMLMAQMRTEGRRLADRLDGLRPSADPAEGAGTSAQSVETTGVGAEEAAGTSAGPNGAMSPPAASHPQPHEDEVRAP
jgi:hypothetical protein